MRASVAVSESSDPETDASPPATTQSGVRPGSLLEGSWVVETLLRSGPTGVAFRCHQASEPTRRATIKVFHDAYPEAWRRFQREAHILKRVRHPNLIQGETARLGADPPYIVLQLWEGPDLRTVLRRAGALPLMQALAIARDLAALLSYLHAKAIYHRDLQPENIVLTQNGPLVVQLGIAPEEPYGVLARPGIRLGEVQYAPPEWASPELTMPQQWDLYALGLTLQAMLTGEEPFALDPSLPEVDRPVRLTKRKRATPFLDPGENFPEPVRRLVRSLSDMQAERRPATSREVHRRLQEILHDLTGDGDFLSGPPPELPEGPDEPLPSLDAPLRTSKPPPPTLVPVHHRAAIGEVVLVATEPGEDPILLGSMDGSTVKMPPYLAVGMLLFAMLVGASMAASAAFLAWWLF